MANYIRNLSAIAGVFLLCFAYIGTMSPASAAVYTFELADHPDRAISTADYGIRLDNYPNDRFFSFDIPGGAFLTVDTDANAGAGSAVIEGVVSENDINGNLQGLWDISYDFNSGLIITDPLTGAFTSTGGGGTLEEQGDDMTSYVLASKANSSGLAMIFSNEIFRGYDGWNGRGWIQGSGTNDFLFTATPGDPGQSVVPVPAALPLLLSGLGLMGWFSRRRKRVVAAA